VGTPGDSRGQRVGAGPLTLLRVDHESRAPSPVLKKGGIGFDSRRLHHSTRSYRARARYSLAHGRPVLSERSESKDPFESWLGRRVECPE